MQWQRERQSLNEGIFFAYTDLSASSTTASDHTEMHNNSFGVWKQENYRYDKLAFILCISGDNGG